VWRYLCPNRHSTFAENHRVIDRHFRLPAAPFSGFVAACVVDQDSTHDLGRDGEEMEAVLPIPLVLPDQDEPKNGS